MFGQLHIRHDVARSGHHNIAVLDIERTSSDDSCTVYNGAYVDEFLRRPNVNHRPKACVWR